MIDLRCQASLNHHATPCIILERRQKKGLMSRSKYASTQLIVCRAFIIIKYSIGLQQQQNIFKLKKESYPILYVKQMGAI